MLPVKPHTCNRFRELIELDCDGELEPSDLRILQAHAATCGGCEREWALARRLQQEFRVLPTVVCPSAVAERVLEQARSSSSVVSRNVLPRNEDRAPSGGAPTGRLVNDEGPLPRPTPISSTRQRWARRENPLVVWLPLAAAVLLAVGAGLDRWRSATSRSALEVVPAAPEYSQAEIDQAENEARLAFAYLGAISRRAGLALRDEVLVKEIVVPSLRAFGVTGPAAVSLGEPQ